MTSRKKASGEATTTRKQAEQTRPGPAHGEAPLTIAVAIDRQSGGMSMAVSPLAQDQGRDLQILLSALQIATQQINRALAELQLQAEQANAPAPNAQPTA